MHRSDFEGPPFHWSLMSILGGIATASVLIAGLEIAVQHQRVLRRDLTHLETSKQAGPALAESPGL